MITNFKTADNLDIGSLFCNVTLAQTIDGSKSFSTVPIVGTIVQSDNSNSAASTAYVRTALTTLSTSSTADVAAMKASLIAELEAVKASYIVELNALKAYYLQQMSDIKMTVERNIITSNCPGCYLVLRHGAVPIFYSVPDLFTYQYYDNGDYIIDHIVVMPGYSVEPHTEIDYGGDGIHPMHFDCTNGTKPILRYFSEISKFLTRSFKLFYKNVQVEPLTDASQKNYLGG
jgi:hypothetical protein